MSENEPKFLEKVMASGEVMSLQWSGHVWDVDQWEIGGEINRWHRWYKTFPEAKAEYDRWN